MRIASSQFQGTLTRTMQINESRLAKLTQQMSSGLRVPLPSDDPISNVRLSRLTREEAMIAQYQDNIGALKIRLQKNEGYLSSMSNDMQQARDLLVWALDGGNAATDLNAMVGSLQSLKQSLLFTANSTDQEGRYVFSGTMTGTRPVTDSGIPAAPGVPRYTFVGNTDQQQVVVGNSITQSANVDIKGIEDLLNLLDQTIGALSVPGVSINDPATRAVVASTLDGVDTAMDTVGVKIASLGGAQNILSTLAANHSNVSVSNQSALLDIGKLDYYAAASDLAGYTMAMQATQKAYAKVSQLTLFDLL
ncbi:MAG TPA: flagellar hook-associated protein FlgL [Burkholderiaceae bacterium]|nr:flagellar hook-associated protein FlgL [Burkholderiaceae bacterium]